MYPPTKDTEVNAPSKEPAIPHQHDVDLLPIACSHNIESVPSTSDPMYTSLSSSESRVVQVDDTQDNDVYTMPDMGASINQLFEEPSTDIKVNLDTQTKCTYSHQILPTQSPEQQQPLVAYQLEYTMQDTGARDIQTNITAWGDTNALSPCNIGSPLDNIGMLSAIDNTGLEQTQRSDPELKLIFEWLEDKKLPDDEKMSKFVRSQSQECIIDNGILYHYYYPRGKGHLSDRLVKQIMVPQRLKHDILLSYHDSLAGGIHQGAERVHNAIRQKFYWHNMFKDIATYVKTCLDCQQAKRHYGAKRAPLQPLPQEDVFHRWHIDMIGPLPTTNNEHKYILLVVCAFSKWCEAFPMKTAGAPEVAKLLYNEIICRYSAPTTLLSDRGSNFMSKLISELCKLFQITRVHTSSYHPQTNAACERMNSYIEQSLRIYIDSNQTNWDDLQPSIMMAYNYRVSPATQSTKFSHNYLVFGREP